MVTYFKQLTSKKMVHHRDTEGTRGIFFFIFPAGACGTNEKGSLLRAKFKWARLAG